MKSYMGMMSQFTDTFVIGLMLGQELSVTWFPHVVYMPWTNAMATMPAVEW